MRFHDLFNHRYVVAIIDVHDHARAHMPDLRREQGPVQGQVRAQADRPGRASCTCGVQVQDPKTIFDPIISKVKSVTSIAYRRASRTRCRSSSTILSPIMNPSESSQITVSSSSCKPAFRNALVISLREVLSPKTSQIYIGSNSEHMQVKQRRRQGAKVAMTPRPPEPKAARWNDRPIFDMIGGLRYKPNCHTRTKAGCGQRTLVPQDLITPSKRQWPPRHSPG